MKKKGFTLIELLAVIVILAIIALIIVPIVSNVIDAARKAAFRESVGGVIDSTASYVQEYILAHNDDFKDYPAVFTCDGESCSNGSAVLTFKGNVPKSGRIIIQDGGVLAEYITDGKYCAYGYKWDLVVENSCGEVDATKPTLSATLNGQKINITMSDNESGIYGYCVTKDDNCNYISTNETYVEHELNEHGTYKVYAKDKKGNVSEYVEIEVPLENFKPSISNSLNGKVVTLTFTLKTEVDSYCINTSDTTEGCSWVSATGTSVEHELASAGTYYAFVKDKKNYVSDSTTFEVTSDAFCAYQPGAVVATYGYSGSVQTFTIPNGCVGTYKLEVWGAQGGKGGGGNCSVSGDRGRGGYGGYSSGNISLDSSSVLYIAVGGAGGASGGAGWNGGGSSNGYNGGGGGATHIATTTNRGVLSSYNSYRDEVLIVAGGGGGTNCDCSTGGNGGGTNGTNSNSAGCGEAHGASQTSGNAFGQGGSSKSGGGGGWYGGYAGGGCSGYWDSGGGGGSGYIGGVTNGTTTTSTQTGNGYARITLVSLN